MSWMRINWSGIAKNILGLKSSPEQQGNLELTETVKNLLKSYINFDQEDYVNSVIESLKVRFTEEFNTEAMKNKIMNDTTDAIYKDLSVLLENSLKSEVAEGVMNKLAEEVQDEAEALYGSDEAALTGSGDVQGLIIS